MKKVARLERVSELSTRLIEGLIDEAEKKELNELLRGDPDACERYLEQAEIHAFLGEFHDTERPPIEASGLPDYMQEEIVPFPTSRSHSGKHYLAAGIAAAAIILLANVWILKWQGIESEPSQATGIAVLSRLVDAEWSQADTSQPEGSALFPGHFSLNSGLAQIEFFSGASIIVEGPVDLNLISAWEMECRNGKLRAFVPEPARGFSITTPDYEAVDLGTEFALSVTSEGTSELHVVDGEVRLDSREGETIKHLNRGDGIRSAEGNLKSIPANESGFVGREQFLNRADASSQSRYERWQETQSVLRNDKHTLVLFDFEEHQRWDRQLLNRNSGGPHAAIIGAKWSEGRWPGKGALEFKGLSDRVRMQIPGTFEALTLAARVRVDGLDRWLSSLFLTDGFDTGEIHWQISDKGSLILGISNNDGKPNTQTESVILPEDFGRWIHLAVTIDRNSGVVTHFLDGEPVMSETRKNLPPLKLGGAEIGNWQPHNDQYPIRSFNGRIDEFMILSRAMSPSGIKTLSEVK